MLGKVRSVLFRLGEVMWR